MEPDANTNQDQQTAEDQAFEAGLKGEEAKAEDTQAEEPKTEEPKTDETEGEADTEGDTATDETQTDTDATDDAGEGAEDGGEDPENQRKAIARQGYAERKATREQVTSLLDTVAKPQSEQDLIDNQGLDPAEAKLEAFKQEQQRKEAIQELTELNTGLKADAQAVVREFPIFDANSKSFDEKFTEEVDTLWREAADFKTDESGQVVLNARIPMYKFYAAFAKARTSGMAAGRAEGQKAAEKMFATAEQPAATKETAKVADDGYTEEERLFLKGLTG